MTSNRVHVENESHHHPRQTAPLPPAPPLVLHLQLGLHQFRLHPGAFLLVVSHPGSVEEVGEMGDCFGCDDGWERHFVAVVCC